MKNNFNWQDISLTYNIIGNGQESMLAFHGFGQDSSVYSSWEKINENRFTIYSFDLFFHGSDWPDSDRPITPDHLHGLFDAFLSEKKIDKFSLMAYSIGARIGFEILKHWPGRILQIILIAPDGIRLNFWYRVATGLPFIRTLFRYTVFNPGVFMKLLEWTVKLKLIHPATGRFALSQMRNEEKRQKVYFTWMTFRLLKTPVKILVKLTEQFKFGLLVFTGEKDNVIPLKNIDRFIRRTKGGRLVMLPVDHHHLIESSAAWIRDHPGSL